MSRDCNGLLPLVLPYLLLAEYAFCAPRVCLFEEGGCSSRGIWFVLPDLRIPSCVKEDGPSAIAFFQGGDSGFRRGLGTPSPVRRLLLGGSPSVTSFPPCPLVCGIVSSGGGVAIRHWNQLYSFYYLVG
jgi:hypothetical protein